MVAAAAVSFPFPLAPESCASILQEGHKKNQQTANMCNKNIIGRKQTGAARDDGQQDNKKTEQASKATSHSQQHMQMSHPKQKARITTHGA